MLSLISLTWLSVQRPWADSQLLETVGTKVYQSLQCDFLYRLRGSSADWNLCQPDFATDRPPPASRELASSSQFRTMTCPFSTKMVITTVFILTDFKIHSIMADLSSSPSWLVDCFEQLTDDVRMSMSCTSKRWWILSITLCEHASAIAL